MTNVSKFSPRRIKIVYTLSILTAIISAIWAALAYFLEIHKLGIFIAVIAVVFLVTAIISKKGHITLARFLYMIAFIVSVSLTSSFIGKAGSVEFILMFALGLPFLMFSYRTEKAMIFSFSAITAFFWFLLYLTDFNLYTNTQMDPALAGGIVYPVSIGTTILLVTGQLIIFSNLNMSYYKKIHDRKDEAIEASNAKSQFLSTMSHEIRTPLNAIIGLSHILGDSHPKPEQVENIEALNYSGKILLNLLNNVLDYSKMESNEIVLDPIPTDIYLAVKQLKKIYEASCLRKGIHMIVDIEENLPIVSLDIVRFNQVINNLISNAIKFTDNGSVTLKIRKENESEDHFELVTEIIDTGIGLTEEQQIKIFDAFTQATNSTTRLYGGTGLGLSIVKKIIEAMDSEIKIESKVTVGSTFYFKVKLYKAKKEELIQTEEKKVHNLKNKKLLLVEDNQINVMVGKQILEKHGLQVDVAEHGQEAVDKVKANTYDLVLMDIQMPIMDGYTATKEIRKFNTTVPILALSASVFMEVKNKILDSGMNGFIFKPFNPDDLLNKIEEQINGSN
ncbi:response regulator [Flavicella sediminum]|uniref:response regulator n=1 Tax=Flavicella sediminum TaxID=2585141 RepID=UPI001FB5C60A|nr:response regulator [Flavicella sediminum]